MEQLIDEYNEEMKNKHIIEKVALFHLQFEAIYPFIDGNGRTGRLMMVTKMIKEYVEEELERYISVLEIANDFNGIS